MQENHTPSSTSHSKRVFPKTLLTRKTLFTILGSFLIGVSLVIYLYWEFVISRHISTDNAYTTADIAQVTPSTSGRIKTIKVIDTQEVRAGDILVILDEADAKLALVQANTSMAHSEVELIKAKVDFKRRKALTSSGSVSAEELTHAESTLKIAQANFESVQAKLEQAKINLERTIIKAPIDGVIAKREVKLGQHVTIGTNLLSIVPVHEIYVNANFKEAQLKKVKIGQRAEIKADLYGASIKYRGQVVGIAGGTGSVFALIPAQNATGNWIKVVQRLPVRIDLNPEDLAKYPLKMGLSMYVDIQTQETKN